MAYVWVDELENELDNAFASTLEMLKDSIDKLSDDEWRSRTDDCFVPIRIACHIIVGLEWLVTDLPPEKHKKARRYNLNWLGPVEEMTHGR
jgi:hypothetical protein